MKKRINWVSNSSSSSCIVIAQYLIDDPKKKKWSDDMVFRSVFTDERCAVDWDGKKWNGLLDGEHQFGWQTVNYHDLGSKWNWLVLQAHYGGEKYRKILDDFLRELNPNYEIDWGRLDNCINNINDPDWSYIDHQSCESYDNADTFEKVESIGIREWLVNKDCYIKNGNDNDCKDDW